MTFAALFVSEKRDKRKVSVFKITPHPSAYG